MKKVLIITYYWPPAGGPGVQRVLKFAKYLPEFGWEPIVLTVEDGEFLAIDHSLLSEVPPFVKVYKEKIWEPISIYKKFTGIPVNKPLQTAAVKEENDTLLKKLSSWIRLNLFIPDAKVAMPFQLYNRGKHLISTYKPSIIFSSSPPQSVHLLAYRLKNWSHLPWVADFRDPWTNIYYYKNLKRFIISKKIDRFIEKKMLQAPDRRVTVGMKCAEDLHKNEYGLSFDIIHNGFDEEDFVKINANVCKKYFYITYTGNMTLQCNPHQFWNDLQKLKNENDQMLKHFRVRIIGNFHPGVKKIVEEKNLSHLVTFEGYRPHLEVIKAQKESAILLLPLPFSENNQAIISGKLFEYLGAQRFILLIGPEDGDAAKIVKETNSGVVLDYNTSTIPILKKIYTLWRNNEFRLADSSKVKQFSRKEEARKLAEIFNETARSGK